ncbi:MAG: ROK family protein [Candidatus Omnitrophota bacterium]
MSNYLGIDWGGTFIKAGVVDSAGKLIKRKVYSCPELRKKEPFLAQIENLFQELKNYKIKAVGIGAPGIINIPKGFIYYLPNIPGWENFELKKVIEKKIKVPVFIDNDANVFALAEALLGAAKEKERVIFITLGTGLGGAIVYNGKIVEGEVSASELGHVPISLEGKLCGCGGRGCIETYAGNRYLLKRYYDLKERKSGVKDVKGIFEKALLGEQEALRVWKEFSHSLGKFLAGMINVFNPEIIVIGGGISEAFNLFKPFLISEIHNQAMWPQLKNLKVVKAKLKDAGVIGAALLARQISEK